MSVKIYKIKSTAGPKVYIGSTTTDLQERWRAHVKSSGLTVAKCTSSLLFGEYGVETCSVELIEEVKEEDRYARERWWVENTEDVVNVRVPGRIGKERFKVSYQKHKEARVEAGRAYKQANKERIAAYCAQRVNCPICNVEVARVSLLRHTKRKH